MDLPLREDFGTSMILETERPANIRHTPLKLKEIYGPIEK